MRTGKCNKCGAKIRWIKSVNNKWMALDWEQVEIAVVCVRNSQETGRVETGYPVHNPNCKGKQ